MRRARALLLVSGGIAVGVVAGVAADGALGGSGAPAPPRIIQVETGYRHTCAVTSAGRVKCWGSNGFGQLGDGTRRIRGRPVDVVGLSGVRAISAGANSTCALTRQGGVKCWGNVRGVRAEPQPSQDRASIRPVDIAGLRRGVTAIASGDRHTCALMTTGAVRCWGSNYSGNSGPVPVDVRGLPSGLRAISAGGGGVTCAITSTGGITCWGTRDGPRWDWGLTSGLAAATLGSTPEFGTDAGPSHLCGLTNGGGVKCAGGNNFGELGNGSTARSSTVAVDVAGLTSGVTAVDAGSSYTCAVTSTGGVKCWGSGSHGQLGNGTTVQAQRTPGDVTGLGSGVVAISASGYFHTCALTSAGRVKCWGWNTAGQLGNGTIKSTSKPVDVVFTRP